MHRPKPFRASVYTKAFHQKAKQYRTEHPNKTYRECLKELSDIYKNNNIDNNI